MRRIDRVVVAAALIAVGLAIMGSAAQGAPSATNQTADRNFAGPMSMCPGSGWSCTDQFPVAQDGNENVILCVGDTAACADSTQNGESNKIECRDEQDGGSLAVQTCGPFTQTGGNNEALFRLAFETDDGSTQCGLQSGEITQDGETNDLKVDFRIVEQTSSGTTQVQEAHQVVIADQEAEEKNQSDVDQVQIQKASGDASTQRQNANQLACAETVPPDCAPAFAGPTQPVACLNLEQDVDGSENISKLLQDVKQEAQTNVATADQQQGAFGTGSDARVHQDAPDDGKNVDVADQKVEQKLIAPNGGETADQDQIEDPQCCGVGSQAGGQGNDETINQTVKQEAGDDADQTGIATAIGFSPTGKCQANQKVENNAGTADQSPSSEPCDEILAASAACFSGGEGGGCEAASGEGVNVCADGFDLVFGESNDPACVQDPYETETSTEPPIG
jgi:hypothetical protein